MLYHTVQRHALLLYCDSKNWAIVSELASMFGNFITQQDNMIGLILEGGYCTITIPEHDSNVLVLLDLAVVACFIMWHASSFKDSKVIFY